MSVRRFAIPVLAAALAAAFGCAPAGPPRAPIDLEVAAAPGEIALTPEGLPISFRQSVIADEYFWLRTKVLEGEAPPPFADAFAAMHDLRASLGGDPTAWEDLEVPLGEVKSGAELVEAYERLPDKKDVDGHVVALRAEALRLARAVVASEAAYRKGPYREHADAIARAAADLNARFVPHEAQIVGAIEADFGLPQGAPPIVITLVSDAPFPGAFAADQRGRVIATFVRVRGLEGSALAETVLHECLNAFDQVTVREPTGLNALRAALAARGVDADDASAEMAMSTVMFVEAASLVRRFVDPGHTPLGESGWYTLYAPAPAIAQAWTRHVEGEALAATADAIVKAVTSP